MTSLLTTTDVRTVDPKLSPLPPVQTEKGSLDPLSARHGVLRGVNHEWARGTVVKGLLEIRYQLPSTAAAKKYVVASHRDIELHSKELRDVTRRAPGRVGEEMHYYVGAVERGTGYLYLFRRGSIVAVVITLNPRGKGEQEAYRLAVLSDQRIIEALSKAP